MVEQLELEIAGEPIMLLADRALYWPAQRRLVIADLHLGKGSIMRRGGIPVPGGGTAADLQRLTALLAGTGAHSLWVLGDFLHGPHAARSDAQWQQFRAEHAAIAITVVPGNHDRHFDAVQAQVTLASEGHRDGPFVFRHAPAAGPDTAAHVICGHLHPVVKLPGMGAHPVFWRRPSMTVLPAFSLFSGGLRIAPADGRGSVLCNGRELAVIG